MDENDLIIFFEKYYNALPTPISRARKHEFAQLSYSRWAVEELCAFVIGCMRCDIKPINAIELFINKMDKYACTNNKNSYIFSVAYDIAEYLYDELLDKYSKEKIS